MIAQVDPDGVLRVQMPERLNNVTIDATILFTATEDNTLTWADKSNLLSPSNSIDDQISWTELVHSLSGA
jgi:hypothetical protein